MDERNSLARSDQKGSLSLSVSLSFRCCPHANVSPRHACQHRFQVRSISRFSSLSFSHPTWQRYIRFVAKILWRVTYSLQLQESFVSFFIGIAYRFAKLIEERVFFPFFTYVRYISESEFRIPFSAISFASDRNNDVSGRSCVFWLGGNETIMQKSMAGDRREGRGNSEGNGMKLCLREVVNEL